MKIRIGILLFSTTATVFIATILLLKPEPMLLESATSTASNPVRYSGILRNRTSEGLLEIRPPARFLKENKVTAFYGKKYIPKNCGDGAVIACATVDTFKKGVVTLPNPCDYPNEFYATIECHEKGHTLGWPGTHGA